MDKSNGNRKALLLLRIGILLLFLLFHMKGNTQNTLHFSQLSKKDGFSSDQANTIIQDKKGFIWVGTWNGLNKYDGYQCIQYFPDYNDSTTLCNREITSLLESRDEKIWIGTTSGLNCLNPENNLITTYHFSHRILSLAEDMDGFIWIGTWDDGLYKLHPENHSQDHFFPGLCISDIFIDSDNQTIWLATYSGLAKFNKETKNETWYKADESQNHLNISSNTITQIEKDTNGSLWIGTWGKGLNRIQYNTSNDSILVDYFTMQQSNKTNPLKSDVIYKLNQDHKGNLWIGSWDKGLFLLTKTELSKNSQETKFYTFQQNYPDENSISGNSISCIFIDRSNMLWVGADKINTSPLTQTGVHRIETRSETDPQIYATVNALENDHNNIWTGTSEGLKLYHNNGLNYTLTQELKESSYTVNNHTYKSNTILSVKSINKNLWVGTNDAGVIIYPKDSSSIINVNNPSFLNTQSRISLSGNKVCAIVPSLINPDIIWIGTMQNGLTRLTLSDNKVISSVFFKTSDKENSISDNNIRVIHEDQDGFVWIGTQNGLNCFNPQTDKIKSFFHTYKDTTSINNNIINCIFEDSGGNLWIGTNSGINLLKQESLFNGDRRVYFRNYPTLDAIGNNIITDITEDLSGSLWIKTYSGIARFNPQSERVIKFYNSNDYFNLSVQRNTAINNSNGTIMMGTNKGIVYFHPDSLYKKSNPPIPCITDILIVNQSITDSRSDTTKQAPYIKEVHLSYKESMLTIQFSAMDFMDSKNNSYAYYLEGYDKTWNNIGKRNYVTFTNIPHGNYTLYYRASNSDGKWSTENSSLKIIITPPWWKTYWAFIIYAVLILIILYLFKEYSIIQVRAKNKLELEFIQGEKDRKLNELKALFFTDLTHEFRTPLTLIQGPAEEISNTKTLPPSIYKHTELILTNTDKLLRLINRLMDFRKIDDEKMTLHPEACNLSDLINHLSESFSFVAKSKNIQFNTQLPQKAVIAMLDYEKIEKIIYNLVSNAFKYTDKEGKIDILADIQENKKSGPIIKIEIKDTGIGIPQEEQGRIFERFYQTHQKKTNNTGGIGLYLAHKLTELHGGQILLESELGKGSSFTILLPYIKVEQEYLQLSSANEKQQNDTSEESVNLESKTNSYKNTTENNYSILIVEDDRELNDFICTGLNKIYTVYSAANGKEGYESALLNMPDLIISDVMMPEMDGFEMAKDLKSNISTSHIPILFLTAKSIFSEQLKGLQTGAMDYILKPFNMEALRLKIANTFAFRESIHKRIRTDKLLEPEAIELSSLDDKLMKDAVDAINNNLDDTSFDVEKFSEVIGLSPNQAYRKIKALTGQTVKEFIRNQRLKTAAMLLLQNKRSVSEIIYMVGFSSPSYFSKCFKEYYQCTPKEYIAQNGDVQEDEGTEF